MDTASIERGLGDPSARKSFSIGICASDDASNLGSLLDVLEGEVFPGNLVLDRIVIVASGCPDHSLAKAREHVNNDRRIALIEEPKRYGKAEAINRVIENVDGDYLVLVNSDALPEKGSVSRLLGVIDGDQDVGTVSARPTLDPRRGVMPDILQLMWTMHNECSLVLNHKRLSNHCSDELMAVRTELLHELPADLVNDGAYIGGEVYSQGYAIKFCPDAGVRIDVPSRFMDLVRQRRRIIYGHLQVWRFIGRAPRTVESLLLVSPIMGLRILVRVLARSPRLMRVFPFAIVGEAISGAFALFDRMTLKKHSVWKRYGN